MTDTKNMNINELNNATGGLPLSDEQIRQLSAMQVTVKVGS